MKKINFNLAAVIFVLAGLFLSINHVSAQKKKEIACVAFYNLENLFDTIDDPNKRDEEYLPNGKNKWTKKKYES
jgi:hypothetical protein